MREKTTYDCQSITPLFLGGADNDIAELRVPSIKGLLRFWWRAIVGLPIKSLQKKEGEIFGSSEEGVGRSNFSIRLVAEKEPVRKNHLMLPHKRRSFTKEGITVDQEFSLILSSLKGNHQNYSEILQASLLLGGIGKRSRRGFGSIKISSINGKASTFDYSLKSILQLINSIKDDYRIVDGKIKLKAQRNLKKRYPFLKEIELSKEPLSSWKEVVEKIGWATHHYAREDAIGIGRGKQRLASPIYISTIKKAPNEYFPIVSTLETVFKNKKTTQRHYEKQEEFKEEILS
ncbi:MAG: type III-B CRISPR module RAMP protein Cmr1 [Candidatus Heimdallarchaeota archaeon]|nr:type III-B CRISPR module RAMP protein Cmr1 [Candidatus Heimdallarchaeota archaeon]